MVYKSVVGLVSCVACAVMFCAGAGMGGEKKITKKNLPGAVLSAFEKAYPKATIRGLSREDENGKTTFEVESLEGKVARDISYTPDGKVAEIEEAIAAGELPAPVQATVSREYPKGKILKAEKVTRESVMEYEIHVRTGKAKHALVVDPAGKVVEKEDNEKEDVKKK